jgi:hypothetical protein
MGTGRYNKLIPAAIAVLFTLTWTRSTGNQAIVNRS